MHGKNGIREWIKRMYECCIILKRVARITTGADAICKGNKDHHDHIYLVTYTRAGNNQCP
jgi:hypothetical protein